MGLMSDIPEILAEVFDQGAIQWRSAVGSGTYAALVGARLSNRHEEVLFDAESSREHLMMLADLAVPSSSSVLATDYEVKEADGTTWAVHGAHGDADAGVRTYTVKRDPALRRGPNKGHA